MKMSEIGTHANLHSGMVIADPVAILYANEAITKLATLYDSACKRETIVLTDVEIDAWVDLPADCLSIKEVRIDGDVSNRWIASQGQIKFPEDGPNEATIEYLRKSNDIVSKTDVPEIHSQYHPAIALFVASRERSRKFGDQENDAQRLMGEFIVESDNVDKRLNNQKGTPKVIGKSAFM